MCRNSASCAVCGRRCCIGLRFLRSKNRRLSCRAYVTFLYCYDRYNCPLFFRSYLRNVIITGWLNCLYIYIFFFYFYATGNLLSLRLSWVEQCGVRISFSLLPSSFYRLHGMRITVHEA
ncbi:hypothetical protein PUN28_019451 [Cardiocondyla obscurior]|uniref:Uncharacterized protein n=1 Tax=Cardiocondyla obscurior TaxID=286306 RepID=A0AAW2E8H5_9HYME